MKQVLTAESSHVTHRGRPPSLPGNGHVANGAAASFPGNMPVLSESRTCPASGLHYRAIGTWQMEQLFRRLATRLCWLYASKRIGASTFTGHGRRGRLGGLGAFQRSNLHQVVSEYASEVPAVATHGQ